MNTVHRFLSEPKARVSFERGLRHFVPYYRAQRLGYLAPAILCPGVFRFPRDHIRTPACEPRHTADTACGSKAVDRAQQCGGSDFRCVSAFDPNSIPDAAGWPNGRRPNDDVTDIAIRAVAGVLLGPVPCLGDGVNVNRVRLGTPDVIAGNNISTVFPFLPTPNSGRSPAAPLQQGPTDHCSVNLS